MTCPRPGNLVFNRLITDKPGIVEHRRLLRELPARRGQLGRLQRDRRHPVACELLGRVRAGRLPHHLAPDDQRRAALGSRDAAHGRWQQDERLRSDGDQSGFRNPWRGDVRRTERRAHHVLRCQLQELRAAAGLRVQRAVRPGDPRRGRHLLRAQRQQLGHDLRDAGLFRQRQLRDLAGRDLLRAAARQGLPGLHATVHRHAGIRRGQGRAEADDRGQLLRPQSSFAGLLPVQPEPAEGSASRTSCSRAASSATSATT